MHPCYRPGGERAARVKQPLGNQVKHDGSSGSERYGFALLPKESFNCVGFLFFCMKLIKLPLHVLGGTRRRRRTRSRRRTKFNNVSLEGGEQ